MKKTFLFLSALLFSLFFMACRDKDADFEVNFSIVGNTFCQNEEVQFTNNSDENLNIFLWNFGDGSTSTERNPLHLFSSSGIYTVSLTGSDSDGNDFASSRTIEIMSCVTAIDECLIVSSTVLNNHREGVDYIVKCEVEVDNCTLIINPGVEIEFEDGASLRFVNGGVINAIGNEQEKIIFTGVTKSKGSWKGIGIEEGAQINQLSYVEILYAGQSSPMPEHTDAKSALTLVRLDNSGEATNINNTFVNFGTDYGLAMIGESNLYHKGTTGENVVVTGCEYVGYAHVSAVYRLSKVDVEETVDSKIISYGSSTGTSNVLWDSVQFVVTEDLNIDAWTLLFKPTEVNVSKDVLITVRENGKLYNTGGGEPAVIQGLIHDTGYWKGLLVQSNRANHLSFSIADGGGGQVLDNFPNVRANIILDDGSKAIFGDNAILNIRSGGCGIAVGFNVDYNMPANLLTWENVGDDICSY